MHATKKRYWNVAILAFVSIVLVVGWSWFVFFRDVDPTSKSNSSDSASVLESLFSGLALIGVIYAIILQRNELALQREELRQTRESLERSAIAQEKSEKNLETQADALLFAARLNATNALTQAYSDEVNLEVAKHPNMDVCEFHSKKKYLQFRSSMEQLLFEFEFQVERVSDNRIPSSVADCLDTVALLNGIWSDMCFRSWQSDEVRSDEVTNYLNKLHQEMENLCANPLIVSQPTLFRMCFNVEQRLKTAKTLNVEFNEGKPGLDDVYEAKIDVVMNRLDGTLRYVKRNSL